MNNAAQEAQERHGQRHKTSLISSRFGSDSHLRASNHLMIYSSECSESIILFISNLAFIGMQPANHIFRGRREGIVPHMGNL